MTTTRRFVQFGFLALTLIGVFVVKGNVEVWCPFGGVAAMYRYISEGKMLCSLGVSNFFILAAVLLITLLLRRAFCGYMCPIGTISEWLRVIASKLGIPAVKVPYGLDRVLGLLKYVVLAVILYFTYQASELIFRGYDPCYALLSRHGEDIEVSTYVVTGAVVLFSLFIMLPFCRWFCPLAAVMSPLSRFGFTRIKRDTTTCVDCGKCTTTCPMGIKVDKVKEVTAARCISCLQCVEVCPEAKNGALQWGPPKSIGGKWPQAALIAILLLCVGVAVGASYLNPIPSFVQERGTPSSETAVLSLKVENLICSGNSELFAYYLDRDDEYELPGYVKVETWPSPSAAEVRITYEPSKLTETAIKEAITEPYYDLVANRWRSSPFTIQGWDPLGLDE